MRHSPLAQQLLLIALGVSLLFSLLLTVLSVLRNDEEARRIQDATMAEVRDSYLPLLAQSLWEVDIAAMQRVLDSIVRVPGIERVELLGQNGQTLRSGQIPSGDQHRHLVRRLVIPPLRGQLHSLGTLELTLDDSALRSRQLRHTLLLLGERLLELLVLALLLYGLIRKLILRPLEKLAAMMRTHRPGDPLPEPRGNFPNNEVGALYTAYANSNQSLNVHLDLLSTQRQQLNVQVVERTAQLSELVAQQRLLSELSAGFIHLQSSHIWPAILHALGRLGESLQTRRCYLLQLDAGGALQQSRSWCATPEHEGWQPAALRLDAPRLRERLRQAMPLCADYATLPPDERRALGALLPEGHGHLLLVPLPLHEEATMLFGCDRDAPWSDNEQALLQLAAEILQGALLRAEQLALLTRTQKALHAANLRLEEQVRRDPLTGLSNRLHFGELRQQAYYLAREHERPLSLLMIDIDHFKRYNDRYGHSAGDHCLACFAEALQRLAGLWRAQAARLGGEEFVLLLPGCDAPQALARAQELVQAVRELPVPLPDGELTRITLSVGAATLSHEHSDIAELMEEADQALYRAKDQGRDRACHAG